LVRQHTGTPSLPRASAYFTVLALCGYRERDADRVWQTVSNAIDTAGDPVSMLEEAVRSMSGPAHHVRSTYRAVVDQMAALRSDDLVLERGSPQYPARLGEVRGAPPFVFVRGRLDLLDGRPALAVVGTRTPTEEGALRARKLGYLLARQGVVVVSGLARGIDAAAHRGALAIGGDTVAVLGTPLTRVYPREHEALQAAIGASGALVSQFAPSLRVERHFFPQRNATMSALCLGTVVVEASETSGALIQARQCLRQGRRLFIPQSALDHPRLTWPRRFVDQGARVFRTIEDLLADLAAPKLELHQDRAVTPAEVITVHVPRA
jgi:DNA processing protein